jgi:hypothetical protein
MSDPREDLADERGIDTGSRPHYRIADLTAARNRPGVRGVNFDGSGKVCQGLLVTMDEAVGFAALRQHPGAARIEFDRPIKISHCLVIAAERPVGLTAARNRPGC